MTDSDSRTNAGDETDGTDKTEQLRSLYLSVTDGDAEPVVESQRDDSDHRELEGERADEAVGPAELHGLGDAIDDPEPAD
ncbi:hypothetical protein HTG_02275 [Natrinema mahii]|nr:hypothetical protein HTG_02275 [Natrinema mahii]